jgi:hypothetical protein
VASESRKHAARRPRPPLPRPGSISSLATREVEAEFGQRFARLLDQLAVEARESVDQ